MSRDVLAEVRDVLTRPELRAKAPDLTPDKVAAFLSELAGYSTWIADVPEVYRLERDPKDSKYVNLAIAASAAYLVTWDRDLLSLMDRSSIQGREFAGRFPQVRILDPPTFLNELKNRPA
jgi:putative PIN family toxin of toxin-antitoxin system